VCVRLLLLAAYVCQFALVPTTFTSDGTMDSFAELRVPAIRSIENPRVLECVSPVFNATHEEMFGPFPVEGQYEVPFTVSLNGQQFTPRAPLLSGGNVDGNQSNISEPGSGSNAVDDMINVTNRAINFVSPHRCSNTAPQQVWLKKCSFGCCCRHTLDGSNRTGAAADLTISLLPDRSTVTRAWSFTAILWS
jgi:hypothetical protein